jgi:ADP-dependent phosphofructokinase/glucokinase
MTTDDQKKVWFEHYQNAPKLTEQAKTINGLVSAFNVNIDAVVKLSGSKIKQIIRALNINEAALLQEGEAKITHAEDALRGLIKCFKEGIAEEWVIEHKATFEILKKHLGTEKLQMGGQAGIVANMAAVCGVDPVYVHAASLPKEQSKQFHNLPNLKSFSSEAKAEKVSAMQRDDEPPMIHYIIEFDKDDSITLDGKKITCPKANRFIATYDPLNLQLHINPTFEKAIASGKFKYDYLVLSGFQLLQKQLPNGQSGVKRIEETAELVSKWREKNPDHILHLELASTQDTAIRKKLASKLGSIADSIGLNERELIDLMKVIGKENLAEACDKNTTAVNLLAALLDAFAFTKAPRIQLHMFGLYLTIQKKNFKLSPEQNRNGMMTAALTAAAKAMTGAIDSPDVLLHAQNEKVSDVGLKELNDLSSYIDAYCGANELKETGIFHHRDFDLIAVPTIIVDNPVSLVGMGDTISSVSLIGAGS